MKKIILKLLYYLFIVFSLYYICVVFYSNFFAPKLEYKELKNIDYAFVSGLEQSYYQNEYDKKVLKEKIEDAFNVHFYIYKEVESFSKETNFIRRGQTILPIRLVTIATSQTKESYMYAYVLGHELAHLKFMAGNERFIEFQVVKVFYESGDVALINIAKWITHRQVYDRDIDDYSCAYYTYNYLLNMEGNKA